LGQEGVSAAATRRTAIAQVERSETLGQTIP
jgi:hypothetical protein